MKSKIVLILCIGMIVGYFVNNIEYKYGRKILNIGTKKLCDYANFFELETVGMGFLKYGEAIDSLNHRIKELELVSKIQNKIIRKNYEEYLKENKDDNLTEEQQWLAFIAIFSAI